MADWIKVPATNYDGIKQGYLPHSGKEYIRDLKRLDIQMAKHINPSTNLFKTIRIKLNHIDVKKFKRGLNK